MDSPHVTLGTEAVPTLGTSAEGELVDWTVLMSALIKTKRKNQKELENGKSLLWIMDLAILM